MRSSRKTGEVTMRLVSIVLLVYTMLLSAAGAASAEAGAASAEAGAASAEAGAASPEGEDVRAAIEAANAALSRDVATKDAAALAGRYTEDAVVIAPGTPVVRGRAAIQAFWATSLAGISSTAFTTHTVESSGDLAYEEGEVKILDPAGGLTTSRYVVVWKRLDGVWYLHRDIWN